MRKWPVLVGLGVAAAGYYLMTKETGGAPFGRSLKRAGDDVELGVRRAANRVDRAVDNLDNDLALDGNGAANTTRRRTPSVKQLGKDVGRDVEDTARTIGRNVEDSARKFGRAVEDTFD